MGFFRKMRAVLAKNGMRILYRKALFLLLLFFSSSVYIFMYQPSLLVNTLNEREFEEKGFTPCMAEVGRWQVRYFKSENWKEGRPTLLYVHGFRSSSNFWTLYLTHFREYNQVVVDLPSHGQTSFLKDFSHDLRSYGRFIEQFCELLDLDDLHLIGTSMGGGTVLSFAGQTKRNIRSIAVSNPLAIMPPKLSVVHEELFKGNNILLPNTRAGLLRMQEVIFGKQLNLSFWKRELMFFVMLENRGRYLEAFSQMQNEGGVDDLLERIQAPVLIIQGDRDQVVDPSCVPIQKKLMPHCEVFWVEEGNHVFTGLQLAMVISKTKDFLSQSS